MKNINILLNRALEKVDETSAHTKQELLINNNSIMLTLKTNTLDIESINKKELFFDDFEANKIYAVYYGREGYYPFIVDDDYEMSSEDNALRFYITQDKKSIEIYCDIFTKVLNAEQCNIEYAKCRNENSLWKFRYYIKSIYPEYSSTHESYIGESLTSILNANKSLSYMDAQIDIITRLLTELIELNRKDMSKESLRIFDHIKDTLNDTSLLNIIDKEKILDKFKYKKYTRDIQIKQKEILIDGNNTKQ